MIYEQIDFQKVEVTSIQLTLEGEVVQGYCRLELPIYQYHKHKKGIASSQLTHQTLCHVDLGFEVALQGLDPLGTHTVR